MVQRYDSWQEFASDMIDPAASSASGAPASPGRPGWRCASTSRPTPTPSPCGSFPRSRPPRGGARQWRRAPPTSSGPRSRSRVVAASVGVFVLVPPAVERHFNPAPPRRGRGLRPRPRPPRPAAGGGPARRLAALGARPAGARLAGPRGRPAHGGGKPRRAGLHRRHPHPARPQHRPQRRRHRRRHAARARAALAAADLGRPPGAGALPGGAAARFRGALRRAR